MILLAFWFGLSLGIASEYYISSLRAGTQVEVCYEKTNQNFSLVLVNSVND